MIETNANVNSQQANSIRSQNDSYSSFQSAINQFSVQESKFFSIFIENWQLFQVNICSYQIMTTTNLFGSRFIIYRIKVITDHVCYYVQKRYRDFLNFYNTISQLYPPKTVFPQKTRLKSKVCPMLTQSRRKAFNDLIEQIIAMRTYNKSVVSELIKFLDIKNNYNSVGLDQNVFLMDRNPDYMKERTFLFGHFLRHQMTKMSVVPNQSLRYLQKVQNLINNTPKSAIKLQDLKAVLIGINQVPGLIQAALSNSNEIVSLTFMRVIKRLLDIEICPFAQPFKKLLQQAPTHIFILNHQQLLQNQQFFNIYFELIDFYCNLKSKQNELSEYQIIKQFLPPWIIEKFKQWKQGKDNIQNFKRRKTKIQMTKLTSFVNFQQKNQLNMSQDQQIKKQSSQSIQESKILFNQQINKIKNNEIEDNQNYSILFKQQNSFCGISLNKKFLHFHLISNKGQSQIIDAIKKWKHNKLVSSYYSSQKITNISKMFINFQGKSQKLFQFQQDIYQSKNTDNNKTIDQSQEKVDTKLFQIYITPPESLKNINSFYFYAKVTPFQQKYIIELLYYFNTKKVQKLFQQQCNKQNDNMWKSVCQTFIQMLPSKTQIMETSQDI